MQFCDFFFFFFKELLCVSICLTTSVSVEFTVEVSVD